MTSFENGPQVERGAEVEQNYSDAERETLVQKTMERVDWLLWERGGKLDTVMLPFAAEASAIAANREPATAKLNLSQWLNYQKYPDGRTEQVQLVMSRLQVASIGSGGISDVPTTRELPPVARITRRFIGGAEAPQTEELYSLGSAGVFEGTKPMGGEKASWQNLHNRLHKLEVWRQLKENPKETRPDVLASRINHFANVLGQARVGSGGLATSRQEVIELMGKSESSQKELQQYYNWVKVALSEAWILSDARVDLNVGIAMVTTEVQAGFDDEHFVSVMLADLKAKEEFAKKIQYDSIVAHIQTLIAELEGRRLA